MSDLHYGLTEEQQTIICRTMETELSDRFGRPVEDIHWDGSIGGWRGTMDGGIANLTPYMAKPIARQVIANNEAAGPRERIGFDHPEAIAGAQTMRDRELVSPIADDKEFQIRLVRALRSLFIVLQLPPLHDTFSERQLENLRHFGARFDELNDYMGWT